MLRLGLVSKTFNDLSVHEVLNIMKENALNVIEWSGDVHVPPDNLEHARHVAELTRQAGIEIVQYGSYYRLCEHENIYEGFMPVMDTAEALGTDTIRVWAGSVASEKADDEYIERFISELELLSDLAAERGMSITFEYHAHTIFDSYMIAMDILLALDRKNVYINWQPGTGVSLLFCVFELKCLIKFVKNAHVFCCAVSGEDMRIEHRALIEGKDDWRQFVNVLNGKDRSLLMEFVVDNSPAQLAEDVKVMRDILALYNIR